MSMKIQFSIITALFFICGLSGGQVSGQTPGPGTNLNNNVASSGILSALLSSTKQNDFNWRGQIAAGGTVEIFGIKGDIKVEASAGSVVEVVALKQGKPSEADQVDVRVIESEGKVRICTAFPNLEGSSNPQCLESLEWRSSEWRDNRELRLRYRDGKRQDIRLVDVQVQFKIRVPAGVHFIARTISGDITVNLGNTDISGSIDLYSLGGSVSLELPKALNAQVRLETGGEIATDFPITVLGRFPGNGVEGTIGNGGTKISLRGSKVELRRASTINQ